ncbi:MAG: hypothetical protein J6T18_07175 [Bacteroidaceae bacterium]|nr:hypothetical protein [Bacteroidaceae bacterium]MBO7589187.1 hypothetical protein [Bacteroidaceae bacterium]
MEEKSRKEYERPSVKVIRLRHEANLLQTSGKRAPYGAPISGNWGF